MALVRSIAATSTVRTAVHQPTHCESSIVRPQGGGVYIQLDTFGSAKRKCVGKVSQSIQLDEAAAKQLMHLLRDAFPDIT
jgi:hypothetical protein